MNPRLLPIIPIALIAVLALVLFKRGGEPPAKPLPQVTAPAKSNVAVATPPAAPSADAGEGAETVDSFQSVKLPAVEERSPKQVDAAAAKDAKGPVEGYAPYEYQDLATGQTKTVPVPELLERAEQGKSEGPTKLPDGWEKRKDGTVQYTEPSGGKGGDRGMTVPLTIKLAPGATVTKVAPKPETLPEKQLNPLDNAKPKPPGAVVPAAVGSEKFKKQYG